MAVNSGMVGAGRRVGWREKEGAATTGRAGRGFQLLAQAVIFGFMGHAEPQPRRYTAEEYFALEEASEIRHEFFEGEVFAMAGASIVHNTIAGNMYMALRQGLRGKKYRVQMEAVRLAVEDGRHYAYPDAMVSCDPHN